MTITSQVTKVSANGNDVATVFSFSPFVVYEETDIQVVTKVIATGVETPITLGTGPTNFSVQVSSYPGTGSITYPASGGTPLPTGSAITIYRVLPLEQTLNLENQGGYFPDLQEVAFDKLTVMDQQQQDSIDRSLKFPVSADIALVPELPAVPEADKTLAWDGVTGKMKNIDSGAASVIAAAASAAAAASSASGASTSATNAANAAAAILGTSTTSLSVTVASKALTTQASKQFAVGQWVSISRIAAPSTYMYGQVTAYTFATGALTVDVTVVSGSGTFTDWNISLSGERGAQGSSGGSPAWDEVTAGIVERATQAEVDASTDDTRGVSPLKLANRASLAQTLTDAATIAWNMNSGVVATVTLGANRTMGLPTNLKVGVYVLHVIQDGTGSRLLTWNAAFKWPAGLAPTLSTVAGRRDIFSFVCDGTNLYGSYMLDVR